MSEPNTGGRDTAARAAVAEADVTSLPGDPAEVAEPPSATHTEEEPEPRFAYEDVEADPSEEAWEQVTLPGEIPEPPPDILEAARFAPGHFLYMTDPNWQGEGPAPSWAVFGRWRTDARGEIVDWEDNEEYRPSPEALGWRPPADPVDEAAQRAVTGYGPVSEVPRALAQLPHVAVVTEPDGAPRVVPAPDGILAIPVFTMPPESDGEADGDGNGAAALPGLPPHRVISVTELLGLAEDTPLLYLSPTAPVTTTIDVDMLRAAVEGRELPEPAGQPWPEEPRAGETGETGQGDAVGQTPAVVRDRALQDVPPAAADVPFTLRSGLVSQEYGRPGEVENHDRERRMKADGGVPGHRGERGSSSSSVDLPS
ncbi:type VII secretion system-associated protein [Streptomyces argenteolus]|uniref:Type VII secretion system-associated protein n=1 Tax=Streptomyces argenteolus TaxID=67274 RepID=A0ABW6XGP1_9ACTN